MQQTTCVALHHTGITGSWMAGGWKVVLRGRERMTWGNDVCRDPDPDESWWSSEQRVVVCQCGSVVMWQCGVAVWWSSTMCGDVAVWWSSSACGRKPGSASQCHSFVVGTVFKPLTIGGRGQFNQHQPSEDQHCLIHLFNFVFMFYTFLGWLTLYDPCDKRLSLWCLLGWLVGGWAAAPTQFKKNIWQRLKRAGRAAAYRAGLHIWGWLT